MASKEDDRVIKKEMRRAKKAQMKVISQGEEYITVEALKQIIYSAQTPDAFERRFVAAVNVFNVLVFKDKDFSAITTATDTTDAIKAFHYGINNFYSRLKDQNISSEELYLMMQEAIAEDKKKKAREDRLKKHEEELKLKPIEEDSEYAKKLKLGGGKTNGKLVEKADE